MGGWVDGWIGGRVDGWMGGWVNIREFCDVLALSIFDFSLFDVRIIY
jgi:hypothetical protein